MADCRLYRLEGKHVCTEELVQISQVEWFISSVLENSDSLNGSIVSFAIHLVGWLGETECWFVRYKKTVENALLKVFKKSGFSQDLSTLTAAYDSLSKIAGHATGLRWIFSDSEDVIQQSYNLLSSGSSVFVDRAVVSFLVTAWTNSILWSENDEVFKEFSESNLSRVCQNIESAVKNERNSSPLCSKVSRLTPVLNLVEEACTRSDRLAGKVMNCLGLYSVVTNLVVTGTGSEGKLAMNILKICIEKSDSDVSKQLEDLTRELYTRGCFKRAQELGVFLLKKGNKAPHLTSQLLEPIKMATITQPTASGNMLSEISQSEFLDVLCHSIGCLKKTDLPVCPELVNLFKMSCDPGDGKQLFMSGRSKLQRVCLNYFLHTCIVDSGRLDKTAAVDITSCLIDIIKNISDHQIYASSLKCLLPLMPNMLATASNGNSKPLSEELSDIIQRHLCSVQWEIRDTTLEFLGQVMEKYGEESPVFDWFTSSHLCNHTWQCLTDSDSYVRATAVTCVSKMLAAQPVWLALISQIGAPEIDIVTKVLSILQTDTEAFPRRTAIRFLLSYYSNKVKVREQCDITVVMETLMTSSKDFDWEVKLAGLEFVENLILQEMADERNYCENSVPSYAVDLLKKKIDDSEIKVPKMLCALCRLELYGCWKALFVAVEDYDQTVCEQADRILLDFSQTLKAVVGDIKLNERKLDELGDILEKHLEQLETNGSELGFQEKKLSNSHHMSSLSSKMCLNQTNSEDCKLNSQDCKSNSGITFQNFGDRSRLKTETLKLIEKLTSYETLMKLSEKSNYDTNPFSLLDDILSYSRKDEESNVVDCY